MTTSKKLKTGACRNFKIIGYRYIAAMFTQIEADGFRIYVAWENEEAALDGFVRWYKAPNTCLEVSEQQIIKACDYGQRVNIDNKLANLLISKI